ncbi:hypothetical protein [Pseudomonas schmalbachii]|uniref:Tox-REase-5 domain-containing protein n=1 Tax=Pseudomonas schmalbachii TaxID=2816993 RepID=A0ABS3TQ40_9PSED|nr:hypothetical protein [Pseudomonas schmalbachii]MBO3275761.1 hypothetical protein [Pseudomonas schmalbachii]
MATPITINGPAVFRPLSDGTTLGLYPHANSVGWAVWSNQNELLNNGSFTPLAYEEFRRKYAELNLPTFDFRPALTGSYSGSGNTIGKITGEGPSSGTSAQGANPPLDKNLLEQAKAGLQNSIDAWVASTGFSTGAMVVGAMATAVSEVFMPESYWEIIPTGKLGKIGKKGVEALGDLVKGEKAAEKAADTARAEEAARKAEEAKKAEQARKPKEPEKKEDGGKVKGNKSAETGKCGEWLSRMDMMDEGFDEILSVQNNSGQGVDLIGRNSQTGEVKAWEVKATETSRAGSLSKAQAEMGGEGFTIDRLRKAANRLGHYQSAPHGTDEAARKALKWIKQSTNISYEKREVFIENIDKGCMKSPKKPSRSKPWPSRNV